MDFLAPLLLLGLATWRYSHLLVHEEGPWHIFAKLRYWAGIRYDALSQPYAESVVGEMLLCLWCTSLWVALFHTLVYFLLPAWVWLGFGWVGALSTMAVWLDLAHDAIGEKFTGVN